ncbi:HAD family hydrolase [Pontibacter burrus]|uniref:HAD family phosphatase n=1 Tax=Pontibacter burrus TaxID=2704466 RepID=A0A6B3M0Y6_9BACT|nr:HAD family phosphatase [Pontibacter burrus]NEM99297.1 HAD family phosphatase [Pontibacter burrus]
MELQNIKNIIFDLGGVIINIDYQKSLHELLNYSKTGTAMEFTQKAQSRLFDLYETGESTCQQFRDSLRQEYNLTATDEEIDAAWNAMLLDIPKERIELLQELGKKYRLFLLSNTNAIHLKKFNEIVAESFTIPNLDSLFEQSYYSHLVGKRKPDAAIFELILEQNGLNKAETLFIDDSIQHIESARKVGLHTLHLQPPLTINQFFKDEVN